MCGRCGEQVFYSPEPLSGVIAAVSIIGPGSAAPTRYEQGKGVLHVCSTRADVAVQRELSPL